MPDEPAPSATPEPTRAPTPHRSSPVAISPPPPSSLRRLDKDDLSVRRMFQALRIAVNAKFSALDTLLRHLPACLRPGGRVAMRTFHSGKDRRVKKAFLAGQRDGTYAAIAEEIIHPSPAECGANLRAIPAKLRWARRA